MTGADQVKDEAVDKSRKTYVLPLHEFGSGGSGETSRRIKSIASRAQRTCQ